MRIGEFNGRRLYTGLRLDYRLRLCAPTSASRAVSAVAELICYSMVAVSAQVSLAVLLVLGMWVLLLSVDTVI